MLPLLTALLVGCGTMNGARPLPPGQHAVGLTGGGALLDAGVELPLPNAVLEGRTGLPQVADRNLDVNYGLNLTAAAFGQLGLHFGASWQLLDQVGWRPALSVTNRVFVYTNALDRTKADPGAWVADQLELTASWQLRSHLVYAGGAEYLDLRNPGLLLTPFAGVQLAPKSDRVRFQLEARWYAFHRQPEALNIHWITPGRGALGVNAGVAVRLGGEP